MLLFLIIAALLISVLVIIAINPLLWLEYERRWTGIDRSRLITDRAKYAATTRLASILVIVVFLVFVLGVINFDSIFEAQGTAQRQLIQQELERDRGLRERFRDRPGLMPPPMEPERPRN